MCVCVCNPGGCVCSDKPHKRSTLRNGGKSSSELSSSTRSRSSERVFGSSRQTAAVMNLHQGEAEGHLTAGHEPFVGQWSSGSNDHQYASLCLSVTYSVCVLC